MNPREFWLRFQDGSNLALVASAGETRDWEGIHVIEYSAFEAAITEASEQDKLVYIRTKERDEAREALVFYKSEKDGNPGRWQYWRASRAKILDDFNAERSRSAKLVDAIEQSIGRADDHGDSWCSRPIRDALAEYSKGESK